MCANYEPAHCDDFTVYFDAQRPEFEYKTDLYPCQDGPILVRQGQHQRGFSSIAASRQLMYSGPLPE